MPDRILLPLIVACALFMENLDSAVLATALPTIAAEFGTSPVDLKLALTAYLLSLAVFIPASGWLADRHGARGVFRLAILVFTLGSVLCGLSDSLAEIVAARIVQGLGGALMVPVGRLVILRAVPKQELIGALAWLTVPALIGPVLGPPLGGFFATYLDWRWIFFINVPIGALGLVLAGRYIPDLKGEGRRRFDTPGFLFLAFGLSALVGGSTALGLAALPPAAAAAPLLLGAAALVAYVGHSRRSSEPILDLSLFAIASFRVSIAGASLFRIGVGALPFLLPLLLQVGFGMTAFQSGLTTFAAALGAVTMKMLAPPILRRFGFRAVLLGNGLAAAVFVAVPAAFTPATPLAAMFALLLAGGFFRSLQFTAMNALTFADVPAARMSHATSLSSVAQQLSLSLGITLGALALETAAQASGGLAVAAFPPAFLVTGAAALAGVALFLRLDRRAGQEVSGHGRLAADAAATAQEES